MTDKPASRLVLENEALRKVAFAAARVRRLGLAFDGMEESLQQIWDADPSMPRSLTGTIMASTAYDTAMRLFDEALVEAADLFVRAEPEVHALLSDNIPRRKTRAQGETDAR